MSALSSVLAVLDSFGSSDSSGFYVTGNLFAPALLAIARPLRQQFPVVLAVLIVLESFDSFDSSGFCVAGNVFASSLPATALPLYKLSPPLYFVFSGKSFSRILSAP